MKLISFVYQGRTSFGCVEAGQVIDFGGIDSRFASLRDTLPHGLALWQRLASEARRRSTIAFEDVGYEPDLSGTRVHR